MTELPGWRRFPPAAQWLHRNAQIATGPDIEGLKANFSRFIEERQQASGGRPLSQQERDHSSTNSSTGLRNVPRLSRD
jgi:hypothetical protein